MSLFYRNCRAVTRLVLERENRPLTAVERALVFDFGRVLFRWRPDVVVAETLPHRCTDPADAVHWAAQIFQSYEGDWQAFQDDDGYRRAKA